MTANTAKPVLLKRVEEKARETSPLWQWLFAAASFFVLIQLGYVYAAQIKQASGILRYEEMITILGAQAVGILGLGLLGNLDKKKGYSHRLLRLSDPRELPPGPFRLGAGMVGLIPGLWWIGPVLGTPAYVYIGFVALDDRNSPEEIF